LRGRFGGGVLNFGGGSGGEAVRLEAFELVDGSIVEAFIDFDAAV